MNYQLDVNLEMDLEAMVDRNGLPHVLDALATICFEKAEHLRSNWQDESAAKEWERFGKAVDKAADKARP